MKAEKISYCMDFDRSYWKASGMGPMRYIVAEGESRAEAIFEWERLYGLQYEEEQMLTHQSLEVGYGIAEDLG